MALVASAEAGLRAAAGGATVVRLRAPGLTLREQEAEAARLVRDCPVPVLVTSRVDLALAAGAAGVHLPEGDLPVAAVRRLAPDLAVGVSVHDPDAAGAAARQGPDYLLFGPVWATPTHPGTLPVGIEALRAVVAAAAPVPVLAVGGVDGAHAERVMRAGAAGWAAIRMYS